MDWWWWLLAVTAAVATWRWHRESVGGSWVRMTREKYLLLAFLAMAACFCWRKETESPIADGAFFVAMVAAIVLAVVAERHRRREGVEEKRHPANDA